MIKFNLYKKGQLTPVITGDNSGVAITGLAAGTVVATGDYEATNTDDTGKQTESERVPVPGFTVPAADPK
ncbi:hypothetical protein [Lentilactobacillus sp. SPB1-3]|uniref:Uncharacterized protein n=1 Tax=Lentilactobacillus terminaliae TaxID=3003483 RepID=A0ACD5DCW6_9LACO|nr:hypothetical protein [Lentilactobacillus sp. SPB1-3]MCZ0978085.1 hypothetical protein [Lentilactobacillus sp. SPB1-3]